MQLLFGRVKSRLHSLHTIDKLLQLLSSYLISGVCRRFQYKNDIETHTHNTHSLLMFFLF